MLELILEMTDPDRPMLEQTISVTDNAVDADLSDLIIALARAYDAFELERLHDKLEELDVRRDDDLDKED